MHGNIQTMGTLRVRTSWLTEFKSLLECAKAVTNQCLQESICEKVKRAGVGRSCQIV